MDPLLLRNQLCFPLYAAARVVVNQYTPLLEKLDITYTQYVTMMVLWEKKQISVKDLGRELFLDSGTLTPLLKKLEKQGFVTRSRSAEDERLLIVSLTDKGEALREEAVEVPQQMKECLQLSDEETSTLYKLLYSLLKQMRDE